jgi:phage terminase small subunit
VPGRGRKPKPTARKIAAGNPGKRALNKDEPDFGLVTNIEPPEWIAGEARDMWERVVPLLCGQKSCK